MIVTFTTLNSVYKFDEERMVYIRFPRKEMREWWEVKDGPLKDGIWHPYLNFHRDTNNTVHVLTPDNDFHTSPLVEDTNAHQ